MTSNGALSGISNGVKKDEPLNRADEVQEVCIDTLFDFAFLCVICVYT